MDQGQRRRVEQAAEKFAEAVKESYGAVADRAVSAQALNAELTQEFFGAVINNLQARSEDNQEAARQFIEGQRRQQEATQELAQGSVESYMEFLNSMFSYYQGGMERAHRQAGPRA